MRTEAEEAIAGRGRGAGGGARDRRLRRRRRVGGGERRGRPRSPRRAGRGRPDDLELARLHRPGPGRHRSPSSSRRRGVSVEYIEDINSNLAVLRQAAAAAASRASPAVATSSSSPTGWRSRCTTSATWRSSTPTTSRRRWTTSRRSSSPRDLRPRPQVLDPVAGRHDRDLGQHRHERRRDHVGQRPVRPQVQGQGDDARRDARHGPAGDAEAMGVDMADATKEDWLAAIDKIDEAVDSGQIRAHHRQRVHRGPDQRQRRRLDRLVRRRLPDRHATTSSGAGPTRAATSGST